MSNTFFLSQRNYNPCTHYKKGIISPYKTKKEGKEKGKRRQERRKLNLWQKKEGRKRETKRTSRKGKKREGEEEEERKIPHPYTTENDK